ncbi:hypothetical protein GQ600_5100 [Phytophthora cactorum]|nr:hypothetical protein GQ600_5100 [Phytophthora cactorum]
MREDLAKAVNKIGNEDNSFSLLLEHEYTGKHIRIFGSEALKGGDRVRFRAFGGANTSAATGKKLRFYSAQLVHDYSYKTYDDDEGIEEHVESISDGRISWTSPEIDGKVRFSQSQLGNFV